MESPARRERPGRGGDGFTLVEMVIAISLLAVIFSAVAMVLSSGLRALAAAKARNQANNVATQGIEDLQRFGFNNLGVCGAYAAPPPAELADTVTLPNCPASVPAPTGACDTIVYGAIPAKEFTCTANKLSYSVRRYVAWVDPLKTTKRLAVFVDWVDLAGNHQVSQQSSLRAPDQGAVLGLDPPEFDSSPPPAAAPSSTPIELDGTNRISAGNIALSAEVTEIFGPASGGLSTAIPTHSPGARFTVNVSPGTSAFPNYNGYKVTLTSTSGAETFTVLRGATTTQWLLVADGSLAHGAGSTTVSFPGDKVYASFGTLDAAGSPESSTLFLDPVGPNGVNGQANWSTTLDAADGFRFGAGSQYFSFGILRAADGKSSAAFATPDVRFCVNLGTGCSATADLPAINTVSAPATVDIDEAGALVGDIAVTAETTNVTAADTVSVSFLTHAGVVSVILAPSATCPVPSAASPGVICTWSGTISRTAGYRFAAEPQPFYFGARQVLEAGTIDQGSTAAAVSPSPVVFS